MENIEQIIEQLNRETSNLKIEVLELKENLADNFASKEDVQKINSLQSVTTNIKSEIIRMQNNLDNYATRDELINLDISNDVEKIITRELSTKGFLTEHQSLEGYLTVQDGDKRYVRIHDLHYQCVKPSDLENALSDYAKLNSLPDFDKYATKEELKDYAKTSIVPSVNNFVIKTDLVDFKRSIFDLFNNYVKREDLPNLNNYATKTELNSYAKLSDIPSVSKFTKQSDFVEFQKYVDDILNREINIDTSLYLTNSKFNEYVNRAENTFATKDEISDSLKRYITVTNIGNYIPKLTGFVSKSDLDIYLTDDDVNEKLLKFKECCIIDKYVTTDDFNKYKNIVDSAFNTYVKERDFSSFVDYQKIINQKINSNFLNYVRIEDLKLFIDDLDSSDYVSLDEFNKLKDIVSGINVNAGNVDIDLSKYITDENLSSNLGSLYTKIKNDYKDVVRKGDIQYLNLVEDNSKLSTFVTYNYLDAYFKKNLPNIETPSLDDYVTNDEIKDLVSSTQVNNLLKKYLKVEDYEPCDLSGYAKTTDLKKTEDALKDAIENIKFETPSLDDYVTNDEIKDLVSSTQVNNLLKKYLKVEDYEPCDLSGYAKTTDLKKTEDALKEAIESIDFEMPSLDDYAKKDDLNRFATAGQVKSLLDKYPTRNEVYTIPEIDNKFYTKADVNSTFVTRNTADKTYLTIKTAKDDYLSKLEAECTYLMVEDYRGIKSCVTLNAYYRNMPDEFFKVLKAGALIDGFYVIGNDIVIVKNGEIFSLGGGTIDMSSYYNKDEIDNKGFATESWVRENYVPIKWEFINEY